jgi:hypothetical protein
MGFAISEVCNSKSDNTVALTPIIAIVSNPFCKRLHATVVEKAS